MLWGNLSKELISVRNFEELDGDVVLSLVPLAIWDKDGVTILRDLVEDPNFRTLSPDAKKHDCLLLKGIKDRDEKFISD